jgi:hypothetical protein
MERNIVTVVDGGLAKGYIYIQSHESEGNVVALGLIRPSKNSQMNQLTYRAGEATGNSEYDLRLGRSLDFMRTANERPSSFESILGASR